jgi:ubiquinone biosynthesis UbiH/UbiF/VisC/COQ6 family hydroxylase
MDADVAIVGTGLAGSALARALRGLSVVLVGGEAAAPPPAHFDARVYAITPGNAAFLGSLGAWPAARATPVHAMRIFGDDARSHLEFDAYRAGVEALAWIVEESALQESLARGGGEPARIAARIESLRVDAEAARLRLADGRTLDARLCVGADGAQSRVREQAGLAATHRDYPQRAVVANFACGRAHGNVAYQWFQGGPVLALLPLPGEHVSMVWSTGEAEAERLLGLAPEALCAQVAAASAGTLGELSLVTPARAFPLRRIAARHTVAPRLALIGDAAHVIHPLAGQGANLGLQDARALAQVLAGREPARDPGDFRLLRRYERARAADVAAMDATVDGLYRLFDAHARPWPRLRNAGLNLADRLPVIKNLLIRQAMA